MPNNVGRGGLDVAKRAAWSSTIGQLVPLGLGAVVGAILVGLISGRPEAPLAAPASVEEAPTKEARDPGPPAGTPRKVPQAAPPAPCENVDRWCELRLHAIGCAPAPFPEELDGVYDPASVHAWADELAEACPRFARDLIHIDCNDYPCLLFVEPQGIELGGAVGTEAPRNWSDPLTCGQAIPGPALKWVTSGFGTKEDYGLIAVYPDRDLDWTSATRAHNRFAWYFADERIED